MTHPRLIYNSSQDFSMWVKMYDLMGNSIRFVNKYRITDNIALVNQYDEENYLKEKYEQINADG